MFDCWRSDFDRCSFKGLCLPLSVGTCLRALHTVYALKNDNSVCRHACSFLIKCFYDFQLWFSLLSCMCTQPNHTVADKSPNYWGCSCCYNNSAVVLICWLSARLVFWIVSPQLLFYLCVSVCTFNWCDDTGSLSLSLPFIPGWYIAQSLSGHEILPCCLGQKKEYLIFSNIKIPSKGLIRIN